MLSVKGIYDGEKIIPKEPINLEKGKQFEVIITFIKPVERINQSVLDKFCGIWKDDRTAQEIVDEIKKDLPNDEIKAIVKNRTKDIWNPSDIRMIKLAEQHGITQSTKC